MELYRHPPFRSETTEVSICPLGDIQWAGDEQDVAYDRLAYHINDVCLGSQNPLFVGVGDYIDFASPSNRDHLTDARLYDTAKRVIANASRDLCDDLYNRLLRPTTAKWLGLTQGHHHHPVVLGKNKQGEDVTVDSDVYLSRRLKAKFLDEFGFIELSWPGGHKFHIVAYHGKGSSVFPWGPLNQLWRMVPNFDADLLLAGHQCLPARARILTRSGFRSHEQALVGEDILAYDLRTGMNRWTPLQAVTVYPNAPLLTARSKSFWLEMTPGHQMVVRSPSGEERLAAIEDAKGWERLVTCAPAEPGQGSVFVREAAILGWLVTDGYMGRKERKYPNFQIGQKKAQHIYALRDLLGVDATEHSRRNGMVYFYLRAPLARTLATILPNKEALPALVTTLSRSARQAMLSAMVAAEGDGKQTFSQQVGPVLDAFLMLTALEGLRTGRLKSSPSGYRSDVRTHRVRILSSHAGPPTVGYLTVAPASSGSVWCPTTEFGTWVAELDGQVFISGNTKKAMAETDRIMFPARGDKLSHMNIKIVGTGGWAKGYINGRATYVSRGALSPVALGQPLIHLRPRFWSGQWDAGMTVES